MLRDSLVALIDSMSTVHFQVLRQAPDRAAVQSQKELGDA